MLSARIDVLLRPAEVQVARRRAFGSQRGVVARVYAVSSGEGGQVQAGEPWRASVDRLAAALAEPGITGSLHVVVSDHFLRYALIPWNENLVADNERLAFARITFGEIYGGMAGDWAVALDQQPAGQPSLAGAIDRTLQLALAQLAARRGVRLRALRGTLAERINRHRRALLPASFCLASLEPGRVTLAFRKESSWFAVRTRRMEASAPETFGSVLKQEAAAVGASDGGSLFLVADEPEMLPSFTSPGWSVTRLVDNPVRAGGEHRALARMATAK